LQILKFTKFIYILYSYIKNITKNPLKYVDILGREIVDLEKYSGIYIVVFENGTIEKRIKN